MYMEKDKTTVIHNLTGTAQYVFFEKDWLLQAYPWW